MRYLSNGIVDKIYEDKIVGKNGNEYITHKVVIKESNGGNTMCIDFRPTSRHIDLIKMLVIGDAVICNFECNSREWNGKYYTNLVGVSIDMYGGSSKYNVEKIADRKKSMLENGVESMESIEEEKWIGRDDDFGKSVKAFVESNKEENDLPF